MQRQSPQIKNGLNKDKLRKDILRKICHAYKRQFDQEVPRELEMSIVIATVEIAKKITNASNLNGYSPLIYKIACILFDNKSENKKKLELLIKKEVKKEMEALTTPKKASNKSYIPSSPISPSPSRFISSTSSLEYNSTSNSSSSPSIRSRSHSSSGTVTPMKFKSASFSTSTPLSPDKLIDYPRKSDHYDIEDSSSDEQSFADSGYFSSPDRSTLISRTGDNLASSISPLSRRFASSSSSLEHNSVSSPYYSPSIRSRSQSSGYYSDEADSRSSGAFTPVKSKEAARLSSVSPNPLSPIKHGAEFATRSLFNFSTYDEVGKTLNKQFLRLKEHRKCEAVELYIKLAKDMFSKSKELSLLEKTKQYRKILEWLFVAFPDMTYLDKRESDKNEIHAIFRSCFQFLFFDDVHDADVSQNVYDLFRNQKWLLKLKRDALSDFSLMPFLGYMYLQLQYKESEDELKKLNLDIPGIVISILKQDMNQGVDADSIPWRDELLDSLFTLNSEWVMESLPLCIKQGNIEYVEQLMKSADLNQEDLVMHFIECGKWRAIISYFSFVKLDKQALEYCIELALSAYQYLEKDVDMHLDEFLSSLFKIFDADQLTTGTFDKLEFAGVLFSKNKWNELADWLPLVEFFDQQAQGVDYCLKALHAGQVEVAKKIEKGLNLKIDLPSICNISSTGYTKEQWLDTFLYVLEIGRLPFISQEKKPKQPTNFFSSKSNQNAQDIKQDLYVNLYAALKGIRSNPRFLVETVKFTDKQLSALLSKNGSFNCFYNKLDETKAAPQLVKHIKNSSIKVSGRVGGYRADSSSEKARDKKSLNKKN